MSAEYTIVCPFLDDDPAYARGVEFGLLCAQMGAALAAAAGGPAVVRGYYLRANQDQILLLASRQGWGVRGLANWDRDWFFAELFWPNAPG